MLWNQRYRLNSYIKSSLWIVPFIALLLYAATIRVLSPLDSWLVWEPSPWSLSGTQTVLETIVTLTLTFTVFTFGSLLVAIQVASGQLTPRIIAATLLRDNAIRFTVGLFIFTLLFATGALGRLDATGRPGLAGLAGLLGFASITAFLYLIDYAARLLRPISIVWRVGDAGRKVIDLVYPEAAEGPGVPPTRRAKLPLPNRTVAHRGKSAVVLAVNLKALVAEAQRQNAIIELVPRVGDFVATGDPLFRIHGSGGSIDERRLGGTVALGPERTIEQDATFAFRIIVDIAIKALSKAINDPTTAVLAIDQLQRLLGVVGSRRLHGEEILDGAGNLCVLFRTPNWEDFIELSFSEIRLYGAGNFQIARRLHAMIEALTQTLPDYRRPALRLQLDLLDRTAQAIHTLPEDLAISRVPDPQGLGGSWSGVSAYETFPAD